MSQDYTYSLAGDFPGGAINEAKMHAEIVASAIATALTGIMLVGDVVTITFVAALSAGDKTILDNDTTGPSGGLIAAHDNSASAPSAAVLTVAADPTSTAVLADKGTILNFNGALYRKLDDGSTTNVEVIGSVDVQAGETGGAILSLPEYTADPTVQANDVWVRNTAGVRRLVFYDGTNKHAVVLTQE